MEEGDGDAGAGRRSSLRKRHVAPKLAVVDESTRRQAAAARLDALENDNAMAPDAIEVRDDDEAFNIDEEMEEVYGDKPRSRNKRRTRQRATEEKQMAVKKGPKTFEELLQEANLESLPAHVPSYLTAGVNKRRRVALVRTKEMALMMMDQRPTSVVQSGIRLKLIFLTLLSVVLCLASVDAAFYASTATEASIKGTCQLPGESNESNSGTKPLVSEAVKDLVLVPVTIANGSTFTMATHVYTTRPEDWRETQGNGFDGLCSHRQDIALVLLHGATYNARYWDADAIDGHPYSFARHFARLCYSVIALDMLGAGQSDRPDGFSLNTNDHVLTIHQILKSLRENDNPFRRRAFKHVVLMGHSFGAILARSVVASFPDSADLLVNTAASFGYEPTLPELGFLLSKNPGPYISLPTEGPRGNMRKIFLHEETVAPSMVDYDLTALVEALPRATFIELGQLFAYRRSPESEDVAKVVEKFQTDRIKIPIFHQCGDRDLFASLESCLQGPLFFPNSPEVVTDLLADTGHSFNLHTNNLLGWTNIARYVAEKYPVESCIL
ncbi:hypothetical protein KFL_001420040 [Klebsormidium nitens]|uniref:AB hydrolase-1 domain-containing protein n=1 Tax=Klebsormidium nitens TaxID=105231 RepID=A0A1Y1I1G3_KLENI|nr:hypothetical protein KFL_001420040 [Klebsormidium nitens]|eukprot:GAQ83279.1 hypothetical protein KFL_001420040 [Klebsormidium nitens]